MGCESCWFVLIRKYIKGTQVLLYFMDIFSKYALFVPLNNENLIDY